MTCARLSQGAFHGFASNRLAAKSVFLSFLYFLFPSANVWQKGEPAIKKKKKES